MRGFLVKNSNYLLIVVFCLSGVLLPFNHEIIAAADSERQVVVEKVEDVPVWKTKWDEARALVKQKKYRQAADGYSELLSVKSNIEEARWEYLQLLVRLKDWDLASNLMGSLVENNPASLDYRLSGGEISLAREEFERAVKYFGWVFTISPNSPHGLTALQGLIDALQGQGRHEKALPLVEQLYIRRPHDADLLRKLATMAMQQGLMAKAGHYFSILIEQFPVDDRIVFQAANIYDQLGKSAKAAYYWKNYLNNHPEYIPFQKKISDYYLAIKENQMALPHLLILVENGEKSNDLLLLIGRIYLNDLKRPDKALGYLKEYLQDKPDDAAVEEEAARIRTVLANDLISIVENDGAWMLWKDLTKLTPDPMAIYLSMVDLLEDVGGEDELYEILTIINQHDPANQKALLGLAEIELHKKRLDSSVSYFKKVVKTAANEKKYLLVSGEIQAQLGNELAALKNFEQFLLHDPANIEISARCMELSGRLGLVSRLVNHFQALKKLADDGRVPVDTENQYVKYLRENHFFKESDETHADLIDKIGDDPGKTTDLLFLKADFLHDQGLVFEAEQLIRRVFISNFRSKDALVRLVELSIRENDIQRGLSWFSLLRGQSSFLNANGVALLDQDPEVTLLQAKLLSRQGRDEEAISLLKLVIYDHGENGVRQAGKIRKDTALFLIRLYLKKGMYEEGLGLADKVIKHDPHGLEVRILADRLRSVVHREGNKLELAGYSFSQLVELARYELEYGGLNAGLSLISAALTRVGNSVRARVVKAQLLLADGQYKAAHAIFQELAAEYPANQYFEKNLLEIELERGNADLIIKNFPYECSTELDGDNERRGFAAWRKIILARSYKALGRYKEALSIYNSMIKTPVEEMIVKRVEDVNVSANLPIKKKSFWNIITFSNPEKSNLTETVMSPAFVGKHLGKLIVIVTTEFYSEYRWQRLIMAEKDQLYSLLEEGG